MRARRVEPVRCALVGLGLIGAEHASILAATSMADLLICCDLDPRAGSRAPAGVSFTSDIDEALGVEGLESIFVCTPEFAHRAVVEKALDRGLAVFCEKPLASTLEDADAMIRMAEVLGGTLVVGHILRFDLRYVAVAEAVQAGRLGRAVHLVARRTSWRDEGRAVRGRTTLPFYLGVHDLDVFRWLAGDVDRVFAEAGGAGVVGEGIPDSVAATVRFVSGAVGLLELSWGTPRGSGIEWDSRLAFIGTEGSAYVDIVETGVSLFLPGGPSFPDTTYWPKAYGEPFGILRFEDERFLELVRHERTWPLSLDDARSAVAAAVALDRSVVEGRPVSLSEVNG
jgi:predicted dehydrogenase